MSNKTFGFDFCFDFCIFDESVFSKDLKKIIYYKTPQLVLVQLGPVLGVRFYYSD